MIPFLTFRLVCSICKQDYDPASLVWRCACGGLLDLAEFPYYGFKELLKAGRIEKMPRILVKDMPNYTAIPSMILWLEAVGTIRSNT